MHGEGFLVCWTAALIALSGLVQAATLDRLRQDSTIRIAYRRDAPPFSYQNGEDKPTGFIVDLCQAVARRLSQQINVPPLSVSYVPVTAADRFDAISQGKADLLCEATTVTISRQKLIDFSVDTFVDGAGLLIAADGPKDLRAAMEPVWLRTAVACTVPIPATVPLSTILVLIPAFLVHQHSDRNIINGTDCSLVERQDNIGR